MSLDTYSLDDCVEQSSSEGQYIKQLHDDNSQLKNTVRSLQEYVALMDEKERTFTAEKKTHIQKSKLLEETIAPLQDTANNYITLKEKSKIQSNEIEKLKSELSLEINANNTKNIENDKRIHSLQESLDEHTDKYSTEVKIMKDDKATLENRNDKLISELNIANDTYTKCSEKKKTELVQQQADMNNMKLDFERIREQDKKQLSALEIGKKAIHEKHVDLLKKTDIISNDRDKAKGQNVSLQKSIDDKERIIQMKEQQLLHQQRHVEIEEKEYKEHLEKENLLLLNANKNLEESREKVISLEKSIEIKTAADNDKSMVIKGLEEEQKLHEKTIQERDKQLCEIECELTDNKQTIIELTKLKDKSENEVIEGRASISVAHRELKVQKKKADSDIAKLELESKSLREKHMNEINTHDRENRKKENTIHNMDKEITHLKNKIMQKREQLDNVETELNRMKRKRITQGKYYRNIIKQMPSPKTDRIHSTISLEVLVYN